MFDPTKPARLKETWLERAFLWFGNLPVWGGFLIVLMMTTVATLLLVVFNLALQIPEPYKYLVSIVISVAIIAIILTGFFRAVINMFRDNLLKYVSGPDALRTMTASGLENLCMALFKAQGYKVRRRAARGKPDGGVDLEIFRGGRRGLVQCKKWTHDEVGVDKVRELLGVMSSKGADFGMIVTTNDFTEPAEAEARGRLELINHARLWEIVQEYRLEPVVEKEQVHPQRPRRRTESAGRLVLKRKEPLQCPECGNRLVLKEKDGFFLACKGYYTQARCGFTAPIEDGRWTGNRDSGARP